ncbi:MAG: DUF1636 domain-containing protein [Defluviicoccus sp.]|nr:DUF1636 domain-containing protein [Defluviicoccus sp.]MDE0275607.1 DUF1636 domain-containing protein [Defluviicoccus sp.]
MVDPENRTNGESEPRDRRPVLHICMTCRPAGAAPDAPNDPAAGSEFHDAIQRRLSARRLESSIRVNPINCMANCEQGCSAALSSPGKWSYIAGFLRAELADDVIDYALVYGASRTGVVMPSKRAPSLRDAVVARVPAHPDDLLEQRDGA